MIMPPTAALRRKREAIGAFCLALALQPNLTAAHAELTALDQQARCEP